MITPMCNWDVFTSGQSPKKTRPIKMLHIQKSGILIGCFQKCIILIGDAFTSSIPAFCTGFVDHLSPEARSFIRGIYTFFENGGKLSEAEKRKLLGILEACEDEGELAADGSHLEPVSEAKIEPTAGTAVSSAPAGSTTETAGGANSGDNEQVSDTL